MPSERDTTPSPVNGTSGQEKDTPVTPRSTGTPRSSSGWDGKLRVERTVVLANPEALSDPDYSDEETVVAGEVIHADEGTSQ